MIGTGTLDRGAVRIDLIGSSDLDLREIVDARGLRDVVALTPPVTYDVAREKLRRSDALLLLQTGTQLQVPAKLYEYIGLGKPIFALTDSAAIAALIRDHNLGWSCHPSDQQALRRAVAELVAAKRSGALRTPRPVPDAFRADRLVARLAQFCSSAADRSAGV
jgi:glycosyltransferase involved in cell wall biosynthesis